MTKLCMNRFRTCYLIISCLLLAVGCSKADDTSKKDTTWYFSDKSKPNIIIILTDQERYHTHWPREWVEKNLPAFNRLKKHGLLFKHAYTSACECAPSRAVLFSGEHYRINTIDRTPSTIGLPSENELHDIGSLLKEHTEYEVVWKGKWHLTPPLKGGHAWTEKDIMNIQEKYSIYGWNPPDAGTAITETVINPDGSIFNALTTLGGGFANNDGRYVYGYREGNPDQTPGWGEGILDYLHKKGTEKKEERKPFCLFISLVNPHDVWVYPTCYEKAGYIKEDFINLGIELPSNYVDDLTTKPSVQKKAQEAYNEQSPLTTDKEKIEYTNFYAYLQTVSDKHIGKILDALDQYGLTDDTIIIRTADHGELGLSHGMREKSYTAYEEMIHIPLIISNPKMYPTPLETEAFYSHLDLLPTIADITGVPKTVPQGKGTSIFPVLSDPSKQVQDSILFTFDDVFFLPVDTPGGHIRAIRDGKWTYAVYFSKDGTNFEYELYDNEKDPGQITNLLYNSTTPEIANEARRLHIKLKEKIDTSNALPDGFPWPNSPF